MPNDDEGNNPSPREHGTNRGQHQGRHRRNQRRHGNRGVEHQRWRQLKFEGWEPRLQGHLYDWTGERTPERYIRATCEISTYVGIAYLKYTADFKAAVDSLDLTNPDEPPAPDPANLVAFEWWKYVYKEYMAKMQEYTNFRSGLYNLVMGQCTEALKECLKSHEDFVGANQNGIAQLILICSLLHTFEECQKLADGLSDVKMAFYKLCQGKYMKLERYHEILLAQVEVLDEVGVTIADIALVRHVAQQHSRDEPVAADHEEAKQIALSIQFIKGTNASHKPYLTHLRNSYLDGLNIYPNTVKRHTISSNGAKKSMARPLWMVMAWHLHSEADKTHQRYRATVVNRLGITRIRQSAQTTRGTTIQQQKKTVSRLVGMESTY